MGFLSASCWAHPLVHESWATWASSRRFKNPHEERNCIEQQTIPLNTCDVEVVDSSLPTEPTTQHGVEPQGIASETAIFNFEGHEVRFVGTADKPEWVRTDVCQILDLVNDTEATRNFAALDLGSVVLISGGQHRKFVTVTESGLYRLIFKSRKESAERFQQWVFHKVLPSIRKTGSYSVPNNQEPHPQPQPHPRPQLNADASIQMIEQDLEHLGVATAFIKGWKYDTLKALHPDHAQMFDSAKRLLMSACMEEESLCNVNLSFLHWVSSIVPIALAVFLFRFS